MSEDKDWEQGKGTARLPERGRVSQTSLICGLETSQDKNGVFKFNIWSYLLRLKYIVILYNSCFPISKGLRLLQGKYSLFTGKMSCLPFLINENIHMPAFVSGRRIWYRLTMLTECKIQKWWDNESNLQFVGVFLLIKHKWGSTAT